MKTRIMFIENKSESLTGEARIGRVKFSKTRKSIHYDDKTFKTLKGVGFKSNYVENVPFENLISLFFLEIVYYS